MSWTVIPSNQLHSLSPSPVIEEMYDFSGIVLTTQQIDMSSLHVASVDLLLLAVTGEAPTAK